MTQNPLLRIAYLVSQYPAVSHTFVQREIGGLRAQNFEILTASINEPDRSIHQMLACEQDESRRTYYVKREGPLKAILAVVKTLFTHPLGFLQGIFSSITLAKWNIKSLFYNFFYFIEAALIGFWMQKHRITHLHVHFANPASTVALLASKIFPLTFSITVHGPDEFYDVTLNHLKEKVKASTFIYCISHYTCSQLMRISDPIDWNKIEISRLGVDTSCYSPKPFNPNPSPLQLLSVARLTLNKGQPILLEALSLVLKQGRQAHLTLVGNGPERDRLAQLVEHLGLSAHVIFKGALNSEETLNCYNHADIFILTSFAEGLPVVLMEAMSMEISCIATAINGIPELIINDLNGLLVAASDVEGTAEAMVKLIDNAPLRERLGKNGRLTIMKHYDLAANTLSLAKQFKKRLPNST
jgi:colanic acid/amylovoran biosynthesis glycosyltransferase